MKTKNLVWPVLAMVLAGVIGGCQLSGGEEELPQDGGSDNKKPTRPTNDSGVTVYPDAIMLGKGSTQPFTASSDGVEDFTWSVSGGVDGTTISLEGVLTVSVDETAARLTVMANPGGTGKYGEAYVYILDNEAGPTVEGIAVSPRTVILAPSDSQTFQAVLLQDDPENGGAAEPNIEWSVDDRDDYFVENGKLVVAGNEEAETLTVRASQDSLYGTAIVTVLGNEEEPIPVNNGIRLDPQRVTVLKGRTTQFTGYDSVGGGSQVSDLYWMVLGGSDGTSISDGGLLTVGAWESANYLTVRAKAGDGNYGTAIVEVLTPQVRVTATSDDVAPGGHVLFTASDAPSQGVDWTVEEPHADGTGIDENGLLTVAGSETPSGILTVKATSREDPANYGTASVTVIATVNLTAIKTVTSGLSGLTVGSDGNFGTGSAYGNGVFVIGSNNGNMFRSIDRGDSWLKVEDSKFDSSAVFGIAYGDGLFVAGGENGKIAYSEDDGVEWTAVTSSIFSGYSISRVRYLNGKFYAVGSTSKMAYSEDGKTWTAVTSGFNGHIRDIAYGSGKFVATGFAPLIRYSPNGIDGWETASDISGVFLENVISIVYVDGKFVAGNNSAGTGNLGYSTGGDSGWSLGGSLTGHVKGIAYGGGKFIAVSPSNNMGYSSNGESWEYNASNTGYNVVYGDGRFVITNGNSNVLVIGD